MSDAILAGAALLAGVLCPLHMWLAHRRGRRAVCCPPASGPNVAGKVNELRDRQQRLAALIAAHDREVRAADSDKASLEVR